MAGGAAGIAAEQVFVLNLIAVGFHPLEEFVDAADGALVAHGGAGIPKGALLLVRQFAIRLEDGDTVFIGILDDQVLEPAHFLSAPAGDGTVIDAFGLVRDHQVLAHAHNFAQTAAHGTCAQRRIETEKVLVRLPERHAVALETRAETLQSGGVLSRRAPQGHVAISLVESGLNRGVHTRAEVIIQGAFYFYAVHQKP